MPEQDRYPYTKVPGKLRDLLQKLPKVGRPPMVTSSWLQSAGWTSSNDRTMIPVLKFAGIVGQDGRPTELWEAIRSPTQTNKARIADAIRSSYADLFALYPDAHRKDAESLRNFFRTHTGGGEQVQAKLVQTFQTLVEFGDFEVPSDIAQEEEEPVLQGEVTSGNPVGVIPRMAAPGIALNVNIQLQLPATADGAVYESLFAAMRKHLVDLNETA